MMIAWNIFEISSATQLHGIKLRGRIRKFSLEHNILCLTENASDKENVVRFAVPVQTDETAISNFVHELIPDVVITPVLKGIENPVLSKIVVNDLSRYSLD